jgi:DNA processing protein
MGRNNIKILRAGDTDFPDILTKITDPVEQLFCIGDISLLSKLSMAVVGSRKCSQYGKQSAFNIGEALALNNAVTISGMAIGVDSMAHLGALKKGGGTIAVLGCGVDVCYPKKNKSLYDEICEKGLVISEYAPGIPPAPWRFPMRNRIIAAIASSVAVIEAGEKSGAAITALRAAEIGTDVFALPGNITSLYSVGTNRLIRDGARIITSVDDLMIEAGIFSDKKTLEMNSLEIEDLLGTEEKQVYEAISRQEGITVSALCDQLRKSSSAVNGIITVLELKGMIYYELGKIFIAKIKK